MPREREQRPEQGAPRSVPNAGREPDARTVVEGQAQINEGSASRTEKLGIIASESRDPPGRKLSFLLKMNPKFRDAWERKLKRLRTQGDHDRALAREAIRGGCTKQETADLIVTHRSEAAQPAKPARYYEGIIADAMRGNESDQAIARLKVAVREVETSSEEMTPEKERTILNDLSVALQTRISRLIKYKSDPPSYRLYTPMGEIGLNSVRSILNLESFRAAVAGVNGKVLRQYSQADWDAIAQCLAYICEEQDLGSESTVQAKAAELVSAYLRSRKPVKDREVARTTQRPLWHAGHLCLFLPDLRKWLALTLLERYRGVELARLLRAAGCRPMNVHFTKGDGKRTTMSMWAVTQLVSDSGFSQCGGEHRRSSEPVDRLNDKTRCNALFDR